MGQYYRPVMEQDTILQVYNREIDGEYTIAKLMEHSWIENDLLKAISSMMYKKKSKLAWVGDYADDEDLKEKDIPLNMNEIWFDDAEAKGLKSIDFDIKDKYIVNWTRKDYIDMKNYCNRSVNTEGYMKGWIIHPLSLITAIGNGRGGGDYDGINEDDVGLWCWEEISIEDEPPKDFHEFIASFKEE